MQSIDNKTTGNEYTASCTIEGVWQGNGGSFVVSSADVWIELQWGIVGQGQWTTEVHCPAGVSSIILPNTSGVRFRSYVAGSPATVSAAIAYPREPPIQFTTQGSATVSANIGVQHNNALVGTEPAIDFVDATGVTWAIADDPANSRVTIQAQASVISQAVIGRIDAAGNVTAGSNFTAVRNSTGNYTITFTTPFASVPVFTANTTDGTNRTFAVIGVTVNAAQFIVEVPGTGAAADQAVGFQILALT